MLRSSVAACGKDGCIKLWDLRSQGPSGLSGLSASTVSQEALFVWQITAALGCFYPKTSWCVLGFFKGQVCSRLATWRPWCCPVITGAPKLILYQKVSLLALWCRVFFLVFRSIRRRKLLQHYDAHGGKRVLEGLRRELSSPNSNCNGSVYTWYTWYTFSFCIFHGTWNEKFEINDDKHGFHWKEARSQDPMVHFTQSRCHLFDRFPPHWRAADICRGGAFDYHRMCQFSSDFNTKSWQNRSVMRDYVRLTIKIGSDSVCSMMVLRCHRMDCEFGIFVRVAWCTRPDSFAALDDKTIQKDTKKSLGTSLNQRNFLSLSDVHLQIQMN